MFTVALGNPTGPTVVSLAGIEYTKAEASVVPFSGVKSLNIALTLISANNPPSASSCSSTVATNALLGSLEFKTALSTEIVLRIAPVS